MKIALLVEIGCFELKPPPETGVFETILETKLNPLYFFEHGHVWLERMATVGFAPKWHTRSPPSVVRGSMAHNYHMDLEEALEYLYLLLCITLHLSDSPFITTIYYL